MCGASIPEKSQGRCVGISLGQCSARAQAGLRFEHAAPAVRSVKNIQLVFFQSDSWYWVLVTKKAPPCTSKRRCVVLSKAKSSLISLRTGTQSHLLLSPLATSSRDFRCRLGKFIVLWLLPLLLYLLYLVWGTTVSLNCVVKVDQQQQEEIWKKTCDRKGLGSAPCRKETERPNIYKYIQNSFKAGRDQFSAGSWDVNRDEFRLQQREETAE